MPREIRESDWKILKQLHALALERFCQRVLSDIADISNDEKITSHQRYLAIYDIVHIQNMELALIFNDLRHSTALFKIAGLQSRGLLENAEYMRFSVETRTLVESILA